jgi:hypothetical protein
MLNIQFDTFQFFSRVKENESKTGTVKFAYYYLFLRLVYYLFEIEPLLFVLRVLAYILHYVSTNWIVSSLTAFTFTTQSLSPLIIKNSLTTLVSVIILFQSFIYFIYSLLMRLRELNDYHYIWQKKKEFKVGWGGRFYRLTFEADKQKCIWKFFC